MIYELINFGVPIQFQSQQWKKSDNRPMMIWARYSARKENGRAIVEVYELIVPMQMHQHITWVPQLYEYINSKCKEHFTQPDMILQHLNIPNES